MPDHQRAGSGGHRPANPSALRNAFSAGTPPTPSSAAETPADDARSDNEPPSTPPPQGRPQPASGAASRPALQATESTALLQNVLREHVHDGPCGHGTFSPRPQSPVASFASTDAETASTSPNGLVESVINTITPSENWKKRWSKHVMTRSINNSDALAQQAGFKANTRMSVARDAPSCPSLDKADLDIGISRTTCHS